MGFHTLHCPGKSRPAHPPRSLYRNLGTPDDSPKFMYIPITRLSRVIRVDVKALASRNSLKKSRRQRGKDQDSEMKPPIKTLPDEFDGPGSGLPLGDTGSEARSSEMIPSRSAVLQACTVTCSLIGALGVAIRQVSHIASAEGWPVSDCSTVLPFSFEMGHLGLIIGLVVLISSLRFLLLATWPDFAKSSEAANRQVLSALEPLDYTIVAFLPGITEELLFRGALLPLSGLDLKSVFLVAALFGILHLGNGRKYSFALWATFVGCAYGYAAMNSSSIIVPMVSHAVNNLVGGIIWRYTSKSSKV